VDPKYREARRQLLEEQRLALLANLGKGANLMGTPQGPKSYAVLLFDGTPGEKNPPKKQAKGLTAEAAGAKALAWLEVADMAFEFPYLVIMGPPQEGGAGGRPFPPPQSTGG